MTGKIKLWTNDGETAKGFPVKLILSHNKKRKRKSLFYVLEEDWDLKNNTPKSSAPDFENKYVLVTDLKSKMQKLHFADLSDFDKAIDFLLEKGQKETSLYSYFQKRINFMKAQNRFGNAKVYEETLVDLKKFRAVLNFEHLDRYFLEAYKQEKKDQGLKNTSIKKNLVTVRAVWNSAIKENVIPYSNPFKGLFDDLPIQKRRARNFYLSLDALKKLKAIDSKHKSYQRAVDLSLLQFYLGGADLIDVYYLKKTDLVNGRCFLTRRKNGQRAYEYDVKLTETAKALIEKYVSLSEFVFPWRKSFEAYLTFRNNHNRNLKRMQKRYEIELSPKNGNLTTKVMRHTFATLAKFKHYEPDLIREVMGHERNDIDTIYKDKYPEAERDAMQEDVTNLSL